MKKIDNTVPVNRFVFKNLPEIIEFLTFNGKDLTNILNDWGVAKLFKDDDGKYAVEIQL